MLCRAGLRQGSNCGAESLHVPVQFGEWNSDAYLDYSETLSQRQFVVVFVWHRRALNCPRLIQARSNFGQGFAIVLKENKASTLRERI